MAIVCVYCINFCRCALPKSERNWKQPCICCSKSSAEHIRVHHPGMSKEEVRTMQTYTDIPGWWDEIYTDIPGWWDEVEIVKVTHVDDPVASIDID